MKEERKEKKEGLGLRGHGRERERERERGGGREKREHNSTELKPFAAQSLKKSKYSYHG